MDTSQFNRIKEKLLKLKELDQQYKTFGSNKHKYLLNSPKTNQELQQFESFYKLVLPQAYKDFLTQIGNGGAGPYYGLYSLEDGIKEAEDHSTTKNENITHSFAQDFPISNQETKKFIDYYNDCLEEGKDNEEIDYLKVPDPLTGVIFLAEYGCGWSYILVVKGEQVGKVWLMGDYFCPCFIENKQWDFFEWYEDWLDLNLGQLDPSFKKGPVINEDLKTINYDGWKLKEIPKETLQYKNLKKLVLSRNCLTEFPQEILQFKELRTLDLSMNPLTAIPENISALENLKKLIINYNGLLDLPLSLAQLKNLEELSLAYSFKLEQLPEVIGEIISLKNLYCTYSEKLEKIPENIGNLKNLAVLQLNKNTSLEYLPENLTSLKNLKSLHLGQTAIKKLPDGFEKLENIEFLGLDIEELDLEDAFQKIKQLPKLTFLQLSHQPTYPKTLGDLKNLKTLVISQNYTLWHKGYKNFPLAEEISLIPNLEILDATNNNQADALPSNIGAIKTLKELLLGATCIKAFPESLQSAPHLEKISGSLENKPGALFGIRPEEKEKVKKWFPNAKTWIY